MLSILGTCSGQHIFLYKICSGIPSKTPFKQNRFLPSHGVSKAQKQCTASQARAAELAQGSLEGRSICTKTIFETYRWVAVKLVLFKSGEAPTWSIANKWLFEILIGLGA